MKPTWQTDDGAVQLYLGDCLDVLPTLGKVDAVVTDPPYGMNAFDGSGTTRKYGIDRKNNWDKPLAKADIECVVAASDRHIIWGGNYYANCLPPSKGWLVWIKPDAVPSMASCELAWTSYQANAKHISHSIAATNFERVGFPAQKPTAVMLWTMSFVDGETIADPFMGSGTPASPASEPAVASSASRRSRNTSRSPRNASSPN